jgi:hypothetical protein
MDLEDQKTLALSTVIAAAAAFETAALQYRDVFTLVETSKYKINNAIKAISIIRKIVQTSNKLNITESRTMKKETYASGAVVYRLIQLVALVPDDKADEMESILENLLDHLLPAIPQ